MPHPTYLPPLEIDAESLPASEIADYFRRHLDECKRLLQFSYDKRGSPNTFMEEWDGFFRVGWYENGYQHLIVHDSLAAATTDFVLFSLGRGRYDESAA